MTISNFDISKSELIRRYKTIDNLETLITLSATDNNPNAKKYQKTLMKHLADWYKHGGYFVLKDGTDLSFNDQDELIDASGKVIKKETIEPLIKSGKLKIADATVACDKYKAEHYKFRVTEDDKDKAPSATGRTQTAYNRLGSYTLIRICALGFYLGIRTAIEWPTGPLSAIANQVLHGVIGFAGLTFGLELLIDSAMMAKAVIAPQGEVEKQLPWHTRLVNIFSKGNRPGRMVNAALWFGINLGCFIVTGGFSLPLAVAGTAVANLIGFGLDMLHTVYRANQSIAKLEDLKITLNDRIKELGVVKLPTDGQQAELSWLTARTKALEQKIEGAYAGRRVGIAATTTALAAGVALFLATFVGMGLITTIGMGAVFPLMLVAAAGYAGCGLILAFNKWGPSLKKAGDEPGSNNSTQPNPSSQKKITEMTPLLRDRSSDISDPSVTTTAHKSVINSSMFPSATESSTAHEQPGLLKGLSV